MSCDIGMKKGEKISDKEFSISWRKSRSVNITDEKALPAIYLIAQDPKIDKAGINEALKNGLTVTGAELTTKNNIQIK